MAVMRFNNWKASRALHAHNWYELIHLPEALMPITGAIYSNASTDDGRTVLTSITGNGTVRINPGNNEIESGKSIYGCIPYVLA